MGTLAKSKSMTTEELKTFVLDKGVSLRWDEACLSAWVHHEDLRRLSFLAKGYLENREVESQLQYNVLYLDLAPLCDYYDIDPEEILAK